MKLFEAETGTITEARLTREKRGVSAETWYLAASAAAGFLLARAMIYGSYAPFGVSFLQAQQKNKRLLATFAGAVIGSCTVWHRADSVRYLAASLIALMLKLILRQVFNTKTRLFAALSTGIAVGLTGLVWRLSTEGSALTTLLYLAELMLSMAAAAVFSYAVNGSGRRFASPYDAEKRMTAVFALLALCCTSFPALTIAGAVIHFGRMAATVLVLAAAFAAGAYGGVITGLLIGLAADLTGTGAPLCTALYAAGGAAAGLAVRGGRLVSAAVFAGVNALAVLILPVGVQAYGAVAEAAAGAVIYALLPRGVMRLLPERRTRTAEESDYEMRLRRHMQAKLHGLAEAYEDIAKTMEPASEGENAKEADLLASAVDAACGRCENRAVCIREMAMDRRALQNILARGRAEPADFSGTVRSRCGRMDDVCACFTLAVRAGRERRIRAGEHRENRALLSRQYGQISALLDAEAEELSEGPHFERALETELKRLAASYGVEAEAAAYRDGSGRLHVELCGTDLHILNGQGKALAEAMQRICGVRMGLPEQLEGRHLSCLSFAEQPDFSCRIGATAEKKRGERISGDCGTYFTGKDGSMYVVLCDGMGSGSEARDEAVRTVKLLESFLRAGIEPKHAADIIRSSVRIRSDGETFATVDIAVVNPKTSELCTIKYRAAPTYLRRKCGGAFAVRMIEGSRELDDIAVTRTPLAEGDMIVLTSDGVTAGGTPSDFCECLKKLHCDNPRELSELLLRMSRTADERDDRTVIALHYAKHEIPV